MYGWRLQAGTEYWHKKLSRRDAGAFLKGMKRYGRPERLADIAQEAGPSLAPLPMAALHALWRGLIAYASPSFDKHAIQDSGSSFLLYTPPGTEAVCAA